MVGTWVIRSLGLGPELRDGAQATHHIVSCQEATGLPLGSGSLEFGVGFILRPDFKQIFPLFFVQTSYQANM